MFYFKPCLTSWIYFLKSSIYLIQQVAIVLLTVVAAVAADTYGYDKSYKPAAVYATPVYTKPVYKEQSYAKETTYEAPKEVYEPVYKTTTYSAAPAYKPSYNSYKEESYVMIINSF